MTKAKIIWEYSELPPVNWDHEYDDMVHTVSSVRVVVLVKFKNSKKQFFARFGTYHWYSKESRMPNRWSIEGLTGTVEVLCWAPLPLKKEIEEMGLLKSDKL